jgi:tetratricopeptide (TPR) repeat protein
MASRAQHALAGLHWERGEAEQALDHIEQALFISREIGYGLGIAHSLVALGDLQAQSGHLGLAQEHLAEAITWFQLTEDEPGLTRAQARLHALQQGESVEDNILSTQTGWVKSHVMLAEGKVYCAFESPMAQQ